MLTKTISFVEDRFSLNTGETRVSPMVFSSGHGFEVDDRLTKSAAGEDALAYAAGLKPIPGARIILVSAMGSSDAWGANKKGDTFPELGLLGKLPTDMMLFDRFKDRIPKEWGISLFPTRFNEEGLQIGGGNTFHEHINRPPRNALGVYAAPGSDCRCGDILAAFWNPIMRRVEIIQTVWERKLPHIVRMIDEGFLPGISMACDVPFDRCSICNHLSRNDSEYCEHLQRGNGLRGKIWNNSKTIMMINDFPMLFDSSIVATPAAVEGRTLRKIAHISHNPLHPEASRPEPVVKEASLDGMQVKAASLVSALRAREIPFTGPQLDQMREVGILKSAGILAHLGMSFTGPELGYLLFPKSASAQTNGAIADQVYGQVLHQRADLSLAEPYKRGVVEILAKQAGMAVIDPTDLSKVIRVAGPMVPARSYAPAILPGRVAGMPDLVAGRVIDLNQPLHGLNQETKAILLTRILADVEIVKHLQNMLVKPLIMWELGKINMDHLVPQTQAHEDHSGMPVLRDMARDYVQLEAGREKFYNSHPGAL